MSPAITAKLPGYHFGAGLLFFMLGRIAKDQFPAWGSLPLIQFPCAFFSSVLLPLGSFLALRALIVQDRNRRELLSLHLSGLGIMVILLVSYFFAYLTVNWMLSWPDRLPRPNMLPNLVEDARNSPKEEQREKDASYAYRLYGEIIAYPLDNLQVVYYVPSEEDKVYRQNMEQSDFKTQQERAYVEKITGQIPYLFALYASTYFFTFLIGGIWLFFKIPAGSTNGQS